MLDVKFWEVTLSVETEKDVTEQALIHHIKNGINPGDGIYVVPESIDCDPFN